MVGAEPREAFDSTKNPAQSSTSGDVKPLPYRALADIQAAPHEDRWLIEGLWGQESAGLVGGPPKAGKSWLVLDLALAVASGGKALSRFPVSKPGPVVLFPAEDRPAAVRERMDVLARARGVEVTSALPLHLITAETLRLDESGDKASLEALLQEVRPRLLILDPLVRLHSGSESNAEHVAEVLGYLRRLQRHYSLAVMVTHHVSKRASVHPGESLRGSSDLHAWGDSNLYLQRLKHAEPGTVRLTIEHRFAPSPEPCFLRLVSQEKGGGLERVPDAQAEEQLVEATNGRAQSAASSPRTLPERLLSILERATEPVSQRALRDALRVRNADLTTSLRELETARRIENLGRMKGWRLRPRGHQTIGEHSV